MQQQLELRTDHAGRKDYLLQLLEQCEDNIRKCCETTRLCRAELMAMAEKERYLSHLLLPPPSLPPSTEPFQPADIQPDFEVYPGRPLGEIEPLQSYLQARTEKLPEQRAEQAFTPLFPSRPKPSPQKEFEGIVLDILRESKRGNPKDHPVILSTIRERFPADKRHLLPPAGSRGVLKTMVEQVPGLRRVLIKNNNDGYFLASM